MRGRTKRGEPAPPKPKPTPEKLAQPFAVSLLALKRELEVKAETDARELEAAKKRPKPAVAPAVRATPKRVTDAMGHYDYDDRAAFHQAFAGVKPMPKPRAARRSGQTEPLSEAERKARDEVGRRAEEAEAAARARLAALVAGDVRFVVERESDGAVAGRRADASLRILDTVTGPKVHPTARLDLHGHDTASATREIARFVRDSSQKSARIVLIVHGKGLHSEGGLGVLADLVVETLTRSAISSRIVAFATASPRLGGLGAMVVRLGAG